MNRDNEGISWHRAHSRLAVIKASGYSNAAMEDNRIALQDNPYTREFAKSTAGLSKISKHFATETTDEQNINERHFSRKGNSPTKPSTAPT